MLTQVATMAACVDPDVARRARSTEFVTAVALAAIIVPITLWFASDEICLLEECGKPEAADFLGEFIGI